MYQRNRGVSLSIIMKSILFLTVCVAIITLIKSQLHQDQHAKKVKIIKPHAHNVQSGGLKHNVLKSMQCGKQCKERKCQKKCQHFKRGRTQRTCKRICINKLKRSQRRPHHRRCGYRCKARKQLRRCRDGCHEDEFSRKSLRICRRMCYRNYRKIISKIRHKCGSRCQRRKKLITCKKDCRNLRSRKLRYACKRKCIHAYKYPPHLKRCGQLCEARKELKKCKSSCHLKRTPAKRNACRRICYKNFRKTKYNAQRKHKCPKCDARKRRRKCKKSCWKLKIFQKREFCRRSCQSTYKQTINKLNNKCDNKCKALKQLQVCKKVCKKLILSWSRSKCYNRCYKQHIKSYKKVEPVCDFHCRQWKRLKKCELYCKRKSKNKEHCKKICFLGYHNSLLKGIKKICDHKCLLAKQLGNCKVICNRRRLTKRGRLICKHNCDRKFSRQRKVVCGPRCKALRRCNGRCFHHFKGKRKIQCNRGCYVRFGKSKLTCGVRCRKMYRLCSPQCKSNRMCFRRCVRQVLYKARLQKKISGFMVVELIRKRQKGERLAYACSFLHKNRLTTRACPALGKRKATCDGDTLSIIFKGKPATLTFCNYRDHLLQPSYVSMAVKKSCFPPLDRKRGRCYNGWKCEGGPIGVTYNNRRITLKFCKKKGIVFDPIEMFGPTFSKKKTVYVKTSEIKKLPLMKKPPVSTSTTRKTDT